MVSFSQASSPSFSVSYWSCGQPLPNYIYINSLSFHLMHSIRKTESHCARNEGNFPCLFLTIIFEWIFSRCIHLYYTAFLRIANSRRDCVLFLAHCRKKQTNGCNTKDYIYFCVFTGSRYFLQHWAGTRFRMTLFQNDAIDSSYLVHNGLTCAVNIGIGLCNAHYNTQIHFITQGIECGAAWQLLVAYIKKTISISY